MNKLTLTALSAAFTLALSPALLAHDGSEVESGTEASANTAASDVLESDPVADPVIANRAAGLYTDGPRMQAGTQADPVAAWGNGSGSDTLDGAEPAEAQADVDFSSLDEDDDGYVTQAEIPSDSRLSSAWQDYDLDGDLRLSRSEFEAWAETRNADAAGMTQTESYDGGARSDLEGSRDSWGTDGAARNLSAGTGVDAGIAGSSDTLESDLHDAGAPHASDRGLGTDAGLHDDIASDAGNEFGTSDAEDFE